MIPICNPDQQYVAEPAKAQPTPDSATVIANQAETIQSLQEQLATIHESYHWDLGQLYRKNADLHKALDDVLKKSDRHQRRADIYRNEIIEMRSK